MPRMAKAQKNVMLPDEALAWLNTEESLTGASHSRIILAALLAYACRSVDRLFWMKIAVQVDKGAISFGRVEDMLIGVGGSCIVERLTPDEIRRLHSLLNDLEGTPPQDAPKKKASRRREK